MAELSPWQRWALDVLAQNVEHTPFAYAMREGTKGLVKKGLAEPIDGTARYRLTTAGTAEWQRRHRNTNAA